MPVAEPVYLKVNCGKAAWNAGWIRFGIRPESLTSLVPTIVSVEEVSALARPGTSSMIAAASRPRSGAASSRRRGPGPPARNW